VAAYAALYLDGVGNIQFFGGNMATSHASIIQINHANTNLLFEGTTFYSDTGPSAVNVFTGAGSMDRVFLTCTNNGVSGAVVGTTGGATNVVIGVTGGQLPATATNDNASSGNVGEYITATVANGTAALTNVTAVNVTSISLTAGDWDVTGVINHTGNASTQVLYTGTSISATSASQGGLVQTFLGNNVAYFGTVNSGGFFVEAPVTRISVSSTTTVYLIAYANFSVSTMAAGGTIRARRVR
jgi:hypothetical protein